MFKTLHSQIVYKNKWMKVYEDAIELPDGKTGIYGHVERSNGAFVAVVNAENEILLVKLYRYPIGQLSWELPGGGIDEGETQLEAALREVTEETGLTLDTAEPIGAFYTLNSCSAEKSHVFIAHVGDVSVSADDVSEDDEYIVEKKFMSLDTVLQMIDDGEITDCLTATVVQLVGRKLSASKM
ncbi:MAG: NUDIX hydrolase [Patescibacteria group bacterium]